MPTRIATTMLALAGTLSLAAGPASARSQTAVHCGDIVTHEHHTRR